MDLSEIEFELPECLIAQYPKEQRDRSRLLVVNRQSKQIAHHTFADLPDLLPVKTRFFRNNASVFKARLLGIRPSGGKVECLLLRPKESKNKEEEHWECLIKPAKKLAVGSEFSSPGTFRARIIRKANQGLHDVAFFPENPSLKLVDLCEKVGAVPLPPYLHRKHPPGGESTDAQLYQTVYADPTKRVAAAAPTAGLHFTNEVMDNLEKRGHRFFDLTLHVGLGTFQPIKTQTLEAHRMHGERYEIPFQTGQALFNSLEEGWQRLAVGTTAVRSIEDFLKKFPEPPKGDTVEEAHLFLSPPARFRGVDALLTNFHLPRSTLLCLVAAFLTPGHPEGLAWLREIYAVAIQEKYRFFSYGDVMLIL